MAHIYILQQNERFEKFYDEHVRLLQSNNCVEKNFLIWFRSYIEQLKAANDPCCTPDIEMLSRPPSRFAYSHPGYIVNGFRFRTKEVDDTKVTQLSGVIVKADLPSGIDGYYGRLIDVVELLFDHQNRIILFECDWCDVYGEGMGFKIDKYGTISLNTRRKLRTNEPFALATQVEQVFYVDDNNAEGWIIPVRARPRDFYNMQDEHLEDDIRDDEEPLQEDNMIDVPIMGEIIDADIYEGINIRVGQEIDSD